MQKKIYTDLLGEDAREIEILFIELKYEETRFLKTKIAPVALVWFPSNTSFTMLHREQCESHFGLSARILWGPITYVVVKYSTGSIF